MTISEVRGRDRRMRNLNQGMFGVSAPSGGGGITLGNILLEDSTSASPSILMNENNIDFIQLEGA